MDMMMQYVKEIQSVQKKLSDSVDAIGFINEVIHCNPDIKNLSVPKVGFLTFSLRYILMLSGCLYFINASFGTYDHWLFRNITLRRHKKVCVIT